MLPDGRKIICSPCQIEKPPGIGGIPLLIVLVFAILIFLLLR